MFEGLESFTQTLKREPSSLSLYKTLTTGLAGVLLAYSLTNSYTLSSHTPSDNLKSPYISMEPNLEKMYDKFLDHEKRLSGLEAKIDERFSHVEELLKDIKNDIKEIKVLKGEFEKFKERNYFLLLLLFTLIIIASPNTFELLKYLINLFFKLK